MGRLLSTPPPETKITSSAQPQKTTQAACITRKRDHTRATDRRRVASSEGAENQKKRVSKCASVLRMLFVEAWRCRLIVAARVLRVARPRLITSIGEALVCTATAFRCTRVAESAPRPLGGWQRSFTHHRSNVMNGIQQAKMWCTR